MLADRLLGCPALPDRPLLPDTRPGCRLPGSPAVPGVAPGSGTQSRYPSGMPVTRLPSRSRSHPRDQYPVQAPVRGAGRPAPQPFPESPPELVPVYRSPSEAPVAQLLSRFRSCPRNWHLIPGYPPGMPVARLSGRPRSFLRERYPSLAVMNFYSLDLTRHKGFLAAISRFFSHPQDIRSYPPRPPVFPPTYPQIRPQTVEFPGPRAARAPEPVSGPGSLRGPEPARGQARCGDPSRLTAGLAPRPLGRLAARPAPGTRAGSGRAPLGAPGPAHGPARSGTLG